jgi:hypothetical protein
MNNVKVKIAKTVSLQGLFFSGTKMYSEGRCLSSENGAVRK